MSKHALMDTLRTASIVNRSVSSFGLESSEEIDSQLREALEHVTSLQRNYDNVTNFYKSVASLECADYSNIISNSANAIISAALKSSGLSAQETPALESMSFSMTGIINNAKNAAAAIWKKICEWFKKLLSNLDSFMIEYRKGFSLIAKRAQDTGNAILKGELLQVTSGIVDTNLNYDTGLLSNNDITWDFLNLKDVHKDLVHDPLTNVYLILEPLISNLEQRGYNGDTYERELLRAVKTILKEFTDPAPAGVDRASILPGAKFTKNIFAGARLTATELTKVDKFTMGGMQAGYEGSIDIVIEKSSAPQSIKPIIARDMLRLSAAINDKNNPWICNKDGGKYLVFAEDLLKSLNSAANKFPDEKSVDLAKRVLLTYANCVVKYNTAMYKVYKHAVLTVNAVITASAKKP